MASCTIRPSTLSGILRVPPSKSHSMRALLYGALCKGRSQIRDVLPSPDVQAMVNACREFGAEVVEHEHHSFSIEGVGGKPKTPSNVLDAGNSGIVLRFVGAVSALCTGYTVITGDASIRELRPVQPLLDGLRQLGAFAESSRQNQHPPIIIRGPLHHGEAKVVAQDSQILSGLLSAAGFLPGKTVIEAVELGERPWVNLTVDWLEGLGVEIEVEGDTFIVYGKREHPAFSYVVPGDFSSAAFPLVAALLTKSEVTLTHLDMEDNQGDKQLIPVLQEMGAEISIEKEAKRLVVGKHSHLQGTTIDVNAMIDALPILAVLGCYAQGETILTNAAIARQKECDRVHCIVTELQKMGADIEETDDGVIVRPAELHGATVFSHHDHRIAMALAVAGLVAHGETTITDIQCIRKSYPEFLMHLRFLGANIEQS